jgi:hypothetical protein
MLAGEENEGGLETYESSVMAVTITMAVTFWAEDQSSGFERSLGPSKSIMLGSFSVMSVSFAWSDDFSMSISMEMRSGAESLNDPLGWGCMLSAMFGGYSDARLLRRSIRLLGFSGSYYQV